MGAALAPTVRAAGAAEPPADLRLAVLRERLLSGDYDMLSLDVFDTLVWRRVPKPADVHLVTARLLRERGRLWPSSTPESFVAERLRAEERARRAQPSSEVTLEEIWAEFPRGYLRDSGAAEGAAAEWEAELELVRPNEAVVALAREARARGLELALVSDTYFSARQVARLAPLEADFVVTSCEHRRSKFNGLHAALLAQARVPAARVLHVGDNRAADVDGPAPLGLHRFWLPCFPEAWEGMVEAELPPVLAARAPLLVHGDEGLTALRGRAMFACASPCERWGAGVLGPLVAGFADWVAERCAAVGATTVLCLMREGRALKHAIDATGAALDTRECFLSRFTALQAAILDGSERALAAFLYRPSAQKRERVLAQLGLALEAFGDSPPPESLDPEATRALIRRVARTPALRRAARAHAAGARARLLAHLDGLVAGGGPRTLAIVDLGYKGTIQGALQRILDHERPQWRTHGLYLVTGGDVHETQAGGAPVEGWLAENGQPISLAHTFMRSPEFVEQSLMADCGTTLGHRDDGTPVLDTPHVPDSQRAAIAEVQRGLDVFVRAWAAHRAAHGTPDGATLLPLLRAIAVRAVARPLEVELELFAGWRHDENFGSGVVRGIADVADLHAWEERHLSAHQLASLPAARVHWPFGFARRIGAVMGEAVASIYLRTASPETFDSAGPERAYVFYWDTGAGLNAAQSQARGYRLNGRGGAWVRETLHLDRGGLRAVAFSLGVPGELVRLTGVRVHRRPEGGGTAVTDHPCDALLTHGLERIAGDWHAVREEPALAMVETPGLEDFTGTVDVDLFFSVQEAA